MVQWVELTKKAPIAWEKVCWPRSVGGFNVLHIETWNKAAICKLLWNLCTKKNKLWVRWVHIYYVKGRQIWEVETKQASWIQNKILKAKKYLDQAGIRIVDVTQMKIFSIKKIYPAMRGEFTKVPQRKLMCNYFAVPRWLFILNLAIQGMLSTKERLAKWGITVDQTCMLCSREQECIDHLFFECDFSKEIWSRILKWQGIHRQLKLWQEEIEWTNTEMRSNNPTAKVFGLTFAGCVYYIWQERNFRIFQNKKRTVDVIIRLLVQDIFCRGSRKCKFENRLRALNWYSLYQLNLVVSS